MRISSDKLDMALAVSCLTSKELCKMSGISTVTMARIKSGVQTPRPATVGKLARALGISIDDLLEEDGA